MTSSSSVGALFSHAPSVCEVVSGGPDLSRMLQGDQTTTERAYQLPHLAIMPLRTLPKITGFPASHIPLLTQNAFTVG